MKLVDMIRPGALVTRGYAERLLKDVTPAIFARYPSLGGAVVTINHPAFVFGHLSLYPVQLAEMLGLPTGGMELPSRYPDLFKMGVDCIDDTTGSVYPPMSEVTGAFFSATDSLISLLDRIVPERLSVPLENPARRERFGTVGAFLAYILLAHPQAHLGQLSAWRRCMGLGPA